METFRSCSQSERSLYFRQPASLFGTYRTKFSRCFLDEERPAHLYPPASGGDMWAPLKRLWGESAGGVWAHPQHQTRRAVWIVCEIHAWSDHAAIRDKANKLCILKPSCLSGYRCDLKRWLLYTFCNWFDITFQLNFASWEHLNVSAGPFYTTWKTLKLSGCHKHIFLFCSSTKQLCPTVIGSPDRVAGTAV